RRSLHETASGLGEDARAYEKLFTPFLRAPHELLGDLLGPLRIPRHPIRLARFGLPGLLPATAAFRARFQGRRARAVLAGCATHSILPLERPLTAAVGTLFALIAHVEDWPIAQGGSQAIGRALASYLGALGGRIETGRHVRSLADIPTARIGRRSDGRDRAADRALRSRISRPHSRAPHDAHRRSRARQSQLPRGCDQRGCRRSLAVFLAARGPTRPLLDAEPAPLHLLGVYPAGRRSPRDVRLLRRPERAADAAAPSGEPLAAPLTAHPFALPNIRLGKAGPTPASIGREVELRILACRPIPGMILRHRPATHHLDVRRAVVPRRDGPSDRVGQAVGTEVVEREAGPDAGGLIVGPDGVGEAPGGPHDGQRPVPHGIELAQAARLEARRHHEEVRAR